MQGRILTLLCVRPGIFVRSASRSRTAVAPLERLKILMQVQGNQKVYRSTWQVSAGPQLADGHGGRGWSLSATLVAAAGRGKVHPAGP